jgi:hypothetical protein
MNKPYTFAILSFALSFVLVGCERSSVTNAPPPANHQYAINVSGTTGVQIDMLLVFKPSSNANPKEEASRITVPFDRSFSACGAWAWFETLPEGKSGTSGDEVSVVMTRDGDRISELQFSLEDENTRHGGLGDL